MKLRDFGIKLIMVKINPIEPEIQNQILADSDIGWVVTGYYTSHNVIIFFC